MYTFLFCVGEEFGAISRAEFRRGDPNRSQERALNRRVRRAGGIRALKI